jgi:hypothetical protein
MMPTITLDDDRAGGAALQRGEVQRRATGILVINDEAAIGLAAVDLIAHRDFTIAFIDLDLADVHGRQVIRPHGT